MRVPVRATPPSLPPSPWFPHPARPAFTLCRPGTQGVLPPRPLQTNTSRCLPGLRFPSHKPPFFPFSWPAKIKPKPSSCFLGTTAFLLPKVRRFFIFSFFLIDRWFPELLFFFPFPPPPGIVGCGFRILILMV